MTSHNYSKRIALIFLSLAFIQACVTSPNRRTDEGDASMRQKLGRLRGEGPRKRILLLPFINDSIEKDPAVARTAREALLAGLRITDNFVILDNNDVPKDLKQFRKDNGYDMEEIAKVAADLGVVAIVEGRILVIKAHRSGDDVGLIRSVKAEVQSTVGIRVFSAANHKEMLNEVRSATSEAKSHRVLSNGKESLTADPDLIRASLVSAFQGMILPITKAVDKLNWNGKVALVSGDRIYLNAGRLTGLNVGDILRVNEDGDSVYDPDTGVFIGRAPGHMKGTLEVISYFGKDGSITVIHSGSGFKENDRVELY
ncbi:MAG: hypothetical protein SGI74_12470 [Oligoflexia bacterium]|nr:hypothetical protein [Oligoflexia bacterium]